MALVLFTARKSQFYTMENVHEYFNKNMDL